MDKDEKAEVESVGDEVDEDSSDKSELGEDQDRKVCLFFFIRNKNGCLKSTSCVRL